MDKSSRGRPIALGPDDVEALEPGDWPGGVRLARLLTKGQTGTDTLVGVCWLAPGDVTEFDLTEPGAGPVPSQETYYLVRGEIRVRFGNETFVAREGQAVYFPPGHAYQVENEGVDETFLVYTVTPAPR
jgi:glyoxylate utilization-related uncharacterized protein